MTTWLDRSKASANFTNRPQLGALRAVGDMSDDDFIALLGFSPTFETLIPGVVGGDKVFGDLTFEDIISILTPTNWTNETEVSVSWTNRNLE